VSSIYGGAVGPPPPPGGFQTGTEFLNLIDLKTFTNTSLEIPMSNIGEDLTPLFGGKPLSLFAGAGGGEMRVYAVDRLLRRDTTPNSTTTMGPNTHGGFSSPETGKIGITTGPQPPDLGSGLTATPNPDNLGLDVFEIACEHRSCRPLALKDRFTVPWNADGLTLGKGSRVRMMATGAHLLTPLCGPHPRDPRRLAGRPPGRPTSPTCRPIPRAASTSGPALRRAGSPSLRRTRSIR